jgi:hypothetical protein
LLWPEAPKLAYPPLAATGNGAPARTIPTNPFCLRLSRVKVPHHTPHVRLTTAILLLQSNPPPAFLTNTYLLWLSTVLRIDTPSSSFSYIYHQNPPRAHLPPKSFAVDGEQLEVQGTIPEWLYGSKRHNGFGKYESAEAGE